MSFRVFSLICVATAAITLATLLCVTHTTAHAQGEPAAAGAPQSMTPEDVQKAIAAGKAFVGPFIDADAPDPSVTLVVVGKDDDVYPMGLMGRKVWCVSYPKVTISVTPANGGAKQEYTHITSLKAWVDPDTGTCFRVNSPPAPNVSPARAAELQEMENEQLQGETWTIPTTAPGFSFAQVMQAVEEVEAPELNAVFVKITPNGNGISCDPNANAPERCWDVELRGLRAFPPILPYDPGSPDYSGKQYVGTRIDVTFLDADTGKFLPGAGGSDVAGEWK